jgi:hypothetical protein
VKLRVLGNYTNDPRNIRLTKGEQIEVDEAQAAYLLADAPGCFEVVTEEVKQARVPANKMVESPKADK